jgi:aldehyde:ferredoxin oxidoreductase
MTLYGYAGKILRLDLTARRATEIDTAKYRSWGGGHGLGSALFWDLCRDKTITDGRHPANVCIIATSPLNGTPVPSAGGRCEVMGVGVGMYPVSWFTRSGFGGRFSTMLKHAGWDAIVIEGRASSPVWIDVRNRRVEFRDAAGLWGKDTWTTQQAIWNVVEVPRGVEAGWWDLNRTAEEALDPAQDQGRTTQKPAVLTIGPAGENLTAAGSLIHDAGNGAGQGGFGAVWGSKNLKAISVIGTGEIPVADPAALLRARQVTKEKYVTDIRQPDFATWAHVGTLPKPLFMNPPPTEDRRPQACQGCINGCRARFAIGYGNESTCQETAWYLPAVRRVAKSPQELSEINLRAADIVQKYGFNSFLFQTGLHWLEHLHEEGVLGPGKKIHSDLPWDKYGTLEFAEKMIDAFSHRQDIGADLADGWVQAAYRWGRAEDLRNGHMQFSYWGMPEHGYDPRAELEWGYGSILGDRDINEHCFNIIFTNVTAAFAFAMPMRIEAAKLVEIIAEKLSPYAVGRPEVLDFGDANMYSEAVAQLTRWHRHYTRFWKQSALFCDLKWPDFYNTNVPDMRGATASADAGEQVFWNAVTGDSFTFDDGIELGRRIWNLDNAIWTLQGRHRDMVHFAPYIYETRYEKGELFPFYMWPCRDERGEWQYADLMGRTLDKKRFEEFKSAFYKLEGWDVESGWPTRRTLEGVGLAHVADTLDKAGRLGRERA